MSFQKVGTLACTAASAAAITDDVHYSRGDGIVAGNAPLKPRPACRGKSKPATAVWVITRRCFMHCRPLGATGGPVVIFRRQRPETSAVPDPVAGTDQVLTPEAH
jgi:hypothetical protein